MLALSNLTYKDVMSHFGERLKQAIDLAGLNQRQVALRSGVDYPLINKICKGRIAPTDTTINALAGLSELGLSAAQMYAWREMDQYPSEVFETATVIHRAQQILKDAPPQIREMDLQAFRELIDAEILRRFGPKPEKDTND